MVLGKVEPRPNARLPINLMMSTSLLDVVVVERVGVHSEKVGNHYELYGDDDLPFQTPRSVAMSMMKDLGMMYWNTGSHVIPVFHYSELGKMLCEDVKPCG